ncbi:MAG TPA: PASTA domain-containing protein [Longimicrobium sp.]|nr:PASTA domain-containing protein [Longimicrobium sp.]
MAINQLGSTGGTPYVAPTYAAPVYAAPTYSPPTYAPISEPIINPDLIGEIALPPPTNTVSSQYPQAGSSVPVGSTVFVTVTDLNYINFGQLEAVSNPAALDTLSLAQATQLIDSSPELKEAVSDPTFEIGGDKAAQLINEASVNVLSEPLRLTSTESLQAISAFRYISPTRL